MGAACLLATGFTACSNEDEEADGGSYGKNATQMPLVSNAGIQFPVTSIYQGSSIGWAFAYQDGSMTAFYNGNPNNATAYTCTSNPLTIQYSYNGSSYNYQEQYSDIKVNSDGFITSCKITYYDYDEYESYTATGSVTLAYDNDGHLILEKYRLDDSEGWWENGTTTYTWENGNLTKMDYTYVAEDEDDDGWHYVEEMTYDEDASRYPNTGVWHFFDGYDANGGSAIFPYGLHYAGLLGKPTRNIPITSKVYDYYDNDNAADAYSGYTYTTTNVRYNNDGSIASIASFCTNGYNASNSTLYFNYNETWSGNENSTSYVVTQYTATAAESGKGQRTRKLNPRRKIMERLAQGSETHTNNTLQ